MDVDSRPLLASAMVALDSAGVPSPDVDAVLLLGHVTGLDRFRLRLGVPIGQEQQAQFAVLVERRSERIPLQHLTGWAYFRHLELKVGPGVFIPRPETESLLEPILVFAAQSGGRLRVVDLCSGSGAIAIAVATEVRGCSVAAVEVSPDALKWTRANVARYVDVADAVGSVIEVVQTDASAVAEEGGALHHLRKSFDVVVSNPPYIPSGAIPRDPEVREHDPEIALFGGGDGLDLVRPLVQQAGLLLRPGGLVVIEHAEVQGESGGTGGVPHVLRGAVDDRGAALFNSVVDHLDLSQRPRFTTALRASA